jgi:putative zinc finger/helix-turn-helix YgiT family protein
MKSPFTGKDMTLQKETRLITFRKEEYEVVYHYYLCEDTREQFTSTALDELNMTQVYNQYRDKHNLPFPEEIRAIRAKYGLSAIKMAEILGFGANVYRNYESGEVPSESNARLIQLVQDPKEFKKLVELSGAIEGKAKEKLLDKIHTLTKEAKKHIFEIKLEDYLLGSKLPDEYSGYKMPSLEKLTEMVVYFASRVQPWKTQLNKLLFYADFSHFKRTGYSMSGTRYCAIPMGPVPDNFNTIFEHIARKDEVDIQIHQFNDGGMGEQFLPNQHRAVQLELFDEEEQATLAAVADKLAPYKTKDIIELSHQESAWINNQESKAKISYLKYAFDLKGV